MRLRTSPAAEFQSLQTRAIMGATLWSRAARGVILVWIALTVWLIWQRVGFYLRELHHAYFGRWILCGIINDTPLLNRLAERLPMYADGGWYTLPSFAAWLDGPQMYRASFYSWYWQLTTGMDGHYGLGTDLFPLVCLALVILWRWRRDPDATEHLRGLRLLTPRQFNRQLAGGWLKRWHRAAPLGRLNGAARRSGIQLGASVLPVEKEFEHFLVTGSPGAGKSTLMRQMLMQIRERGQPAIVLDVEGEFVQEFHDEARGDFILNGLDRRCPFWSPFLEFKDETLPMDLEAMASSLIRTPPRDAAQEFFFRTGRKLLKCLFQVMEEREPQAVFDFLSQPPEDIQQALKGTVAYRLVDPGLKETGHNIIGTALTAVGPFEHLPHSNEASRQWSAREWVQSRKGWIFLTSTAAAQAAIQPMQAIWLDCLVRWLMDAEISNDPKDQVWIVADELPALEYQANILTLLTRGRKRGLAVVIGFQNIAQLRTIYGDNGAITITSAPTTKVVLRCDEPQTARWASDLIGSHEVERLQMTQLAGLSTYREGINLQPHRSVEHLVLPAEIQMLEPFNGYLCVAGNDRTTIQIPRLHLTPHQPAFLPRTRAMQPQSESSAPAPSPPIDEPTDQEIIAQLATRH
jgi:Type IV secretion-system coupling protein DNA-binding domain